MKILVVYYSMCGHIHRMAEAVAGAQGERLPSEKELAAARFQGKHVAMIASKLAK